jgi:membrane-bound metal-dependent hydrolase YbcI (DUF457 family)
MPTPIAHTIAGSCLVALASRRLPAASALPVAAAILFAANLPDLDYLAALGGREAMERLHQGAVHSIGFVGAATLPFAWALRRRLGLRRAWLLLAGAGLTHLLLDLMVVDRKPPVGFPFFWPFSAERFHSPVTVFPGIDRVDILGARNLNELLVELACGIPALLVAMRLGNSRMVGGEGDSACKELR